MAFRAPLRTGKFYTYKPLDHAARDIRILRLQQGRPDDPLRGSLSIVSLLTSPTYDALSYMWGSSSLADTIYISRRKLPITASLAAALRNLRYPDADLMIWVDAVCIDQANLAERGDQVAMMKRIYGKASLVRLWINADVNSQDPACTKLCAFDEQVPDASTLLDTTPEFWRPVVPIFKDPYWNRLWIQQEVINARKLQVHCPALTFSGRALAKFQDVTDELHRHCMYGAIPHAPEWLQLFAELGIMFSFSGSINSFAERSQGSRGNLLALLPDAQQLFVSDERDRVYAVMQLAGDYDEGGITVDYTLETDTVFVSALRYHICRHSTLDFLSQVMLQPSIARRPSWVPDWTLSAPPMFGKPREFAASAQFLSMLDCLSDNAKVLRIQGICVDALHHAAEAAGDPSGWNAFDDEREATNVWMMLCRALPDLDHLCDIGLALPQHFCEVLLRPFKLNSVVEQLSGYIPEALKRIRAVAHVSSFAEYDVISSGPEEGSYFEAITDGLYRTCMIMRLLFSVGYIWPTRRQRLAFSTAFTGQEGDEIWVILGCHMPIILRPDGQPGQYIVVSPAYVPGLMEGEAVEGLRDDYQDGDWCGGHQVRSISLV
ncbi:hypothetical protein LTR17_020654 [Elasticomyces elasticus]|nr:hypothetical protein LTR17_020654 [Elasticomyces elasticus]